MDGYKKPENFHGIGIRAVFKKYKTTKITLT